MNMRRWQVVITIILFFVFGSAFFLLFRFVEKNSTKFEQWIVSTYKSIFYKSENYSSKKEHCQDCHLVQGSFSSFHNPKVIGCSSCHLGEPLGEDKNIAHSGMISTPGNLSIVDKTCGKAECHREIATRVSKSLMNTMSGVVSVDKFVFGELSKPEGLFDIKRIGHSPAGTHLRNLCASCHLGKDKTEPGAIDELSRGGGCSACHLFYDSVAMNELSSYKRMKNFVPRSHPEVSLKVPVQSCFGCHSRSGRISTNYIGLMETTLEELPRTHSQDFVKLMDGRIFVRVKPDVHYQKGMDCIDCHLSSEIMGDGNSYEHKEKQIKISCSDCHPSESPRSVDFDNLDEESKKIISLRGWYNLLKAKFVVAGKSGKPYSNVVMENGKIFVYKKGGNRTWVSPKQSQICLTSQKIHPTIDCKVCHTQWVPRCSSCHTSYDPNSVGWDNLLDKETDGGWKEIGGNFLATFPTLGNIQNGKETKISTFMPGMILEIDGSKFPSNGIAKTGRFFAPTFSHTISKQVPTCKDCHLNPLVLGFGSGEFEFQKNGKKLKLEFHPTFASSQFDNLPLDAWIDFKRLRKGLSTRSDASSLQPKQIQRVLNIGTCFYCHNWSDSQSLNIFMTDYRRKMSSKCLQLDMK